ncbi:hypothetical protein [uncultured Kiloniella sp.]|uniref:hypothetical protein n=1 Tax=uncultured Kiloniella sp. TaxID=1133091 RepID=UPI0026098C51|nr:hypothetical protein [uncultured Kiloniella sp.]
MIKVAFYRNKGKWWNRLIRFWTSGPYSHCEIVLDPKTGLCVSSSEWDGGCRYKTIDLHPDHWDLVTLNDVFPHKVKTFANPKCDAKLKYDWLGILLSQVLPLARHSKNKWFCSEFCAAAIGLSEAQRYSPNALYRLLSDFNILHHRKKSHKKDMSHAS